MAQKTATGSRVASLIALERWARRATSSIASACSLLPEEACWTGAVISSMDTERSSTFAGALCPLGHILRAAGQLRRGGVYRSMAAVTSSANRPVFCVVGAAVEDHEPGVGRPVGFEEMDLPGPGIRCRGVRVLWAWTATPRVARSVWTDRQATGAQSVGDRPRRSRRIAGRGGWPGTVTPPVRRSGSRCGRRRRSRAGTRGRRSPSRAGWSRASRFPRDRPRVRR